MTRDSFRTSRWSIVLRAQSEDDPDRRSALNNLCEAYWRPLYVYLRRKNFSESDAQDAVQGFFVHFLGKDLLGRAEPGRGRFRSYLLAVLEHYLANEHRRAHALKRGAGAVPLSLDFRNADRDSGFDPADHETPEGAYTRAWAMTVLRKAVDSFRREFLETRPAAQLSAVLGNLAAESEPETYAAAAERLGLSTADYSNLLQASRKRLRDHVRDVLRDTAESESDVEEEMRELFKSLH